MAYYVKIENEIVTDVIAADQTYLDFVGGEWIEINYDDFYTDLKVGIGYKYNRENNTFNQ